VGASHVSASTSDPDPTGRVHVLTHTGATWSYDDTLLALSFAQDQFGSSLALDGDTLVIGAPVATAVEGHTQAGAAFVYRRVAGTWEPEAELASASVPSLGFLGVAVAVDGDDVIVGDGDLAGPGAAYRFQRRPDGSWGESQRLAPADGDRFDGFGGAVAIDGGTVAIGAVGDDGADDSIGLAGAVHLFQ
jgi:hypothetical protein